MKGIQMANLGSEIQAAMKAAKFTDIGFEVRKVLEQQSQGFAKQLREAKEALRAAQVLQKPKEN